MFHLKYKKINLISGMNKMIGCCENTDLVPQQCNYVYQESCQRYSGIGNDTKRNRKRSCIAYRV